MRWLRLLQLLARFLLKWIRTMLLQPDSIVPSYDICCFFFFFFFLNSLSILGLLDEQYFCALYVLGFLNNLHL